MSTPSLEIFFTDYYSSVILILNNPMHPSIQSRMNHVLSSSLALALWSLSTIAAEPAKPIKALLVTGGCCHDYTRQKAIMPDGISARANVTWTVVQEGGSGVNRQDIQNSIYQKPDWAKGFDIVVHNECFADDADPEFIERVLAPHRSGLPAVVLHCTMHTFRALKTDVFREFLGVTSTHHGIQHPLDIKNLQPNHPVMKGFPALWITGNEELYAIDKLWPNTVALGQAPDKKKDASGAWVDAPKQNTVIWVNTFGKGRVFGTTLAHNNKTMQDPVCLDLFTRGLLWACDKLDAEGKPVAGYGAAK